MLHCNNRNACGEKEESGKEAKEENKLNSKLSPVYTLSSMCGRITVQQWLAKTGKVVGAMCETEMLSCRHVVRFSHMCQQGIGHLSGTSSTDTTIQTHN